MPPYPSSSPVSGTVIRGVSGSSGSSVRPSTSGSSVSDTAAAFTGVVRDELLSQQDSLFSFSEVLVPCRPVPHHLRVVRLVLANLRLLAQLYNITRYTDTLEVCFDRGRRSLSPR